MYMLQGFVPALPHLQSCLEGQDQAPVLPTPLDPLLAHSFSRHKRPAGTLSKCPSQYNAGLSEHIYLFHVAEMVTAQTKWSGLL